MSYLEVNFHSDTLGMDTSFSVIMPQAMQGIGLAGSNSEKKKIPGPLASSWTQ